MPAGRDLGPISPETPGLHLEPELALGAGGGTSLLIAGNLLYRFRALPLGGTHIAPHAGVGVGLLAAGGGAAGRSGGEGVVNLMYGASIATGMDVFGTEGGLDLFLEHQGIDLFYRNRLLLGMRWGLGARP